MYPTIGHDIALHAAGIADALRLAQIDDHDGDARYWEIANRMGGAIGIMAEIALAAEFMEAFRHRVSDDAQWGNELPHAYEAWFAIACGLWNDMGRLAPLEIVATQLLRLIVYRNDENWESML